MTLALSDSEPPPLIQDAVKIVVMRSAVVAEIPCRLDSPLEFCLPLSERGDVACWDVMSEIKFATRIPRREHWSSDCSYWEGQGARCR